MALSPAQRSRSYSDALIHANRTGQLDRLIAVIHEGVQQGLAAALLSGSSEPAAWNEAARARAGRWVEAVDRGWRVAVGAPLADRVERPLAGGAAAIARLIRRGYRFGSDPEPNCVSWRLSQPIPTHFDLAIARLRGGPGSWLIALVAASIGAEGRIGAVDPPESVSAILVAPDAEADDVADGRFQHWLAVRLEQCVRGLSHWM
jgi:hypothetical protein